MGCFRLLLAIFVVIAHASLFGMRTRIGGNAVEVFFMLSGFYMALVLDGKYSTRSWPDISSFYLSRFLRLWPTFLITTLACYAFWLFHYLRLGREPNSAGPILEWAGPWFASAVRFSNLFMIGQDVPSWFHVSNEGGAHLTFGPARQLPDGSLWAGDAREIGQAWSIGTEIWFYLLAPFLMRARTTTLVAFAVAGLSIRYYMEGVRELAAYFFMPAQLPLFLTGALAYRARNHPIVTRRSMALLPFVAMLAWSIAVLAPSVDLRLKWLVYAAVALGLPALFATTKDLSGDRTIGELSYPVYIVHMLVLSMLAPVAKRLDIAASGQLLLLFVLPIAYCLYRFVERPVDAWRQAFVQRRWARSSMATTR